jgi:aminopeptidase-like protein
LNSGKNLRGLIEIFDAEKAGAECYELIQALYPICRSITGDGVRQSLRLLQSVVPLEVHEVPSGTAVLDWEVPREWNIRDAWIKNEQGEKIVDFQRHNLHVLNYSVPVHKTMSLAELRPHLFTLPNHPDWIPYRTSYYRENWGFCLPHRQLASLSEGEYEVCIDSTLAPGSLSYGELVLQGQSEEEVLISSHACHPSLANDNLSGMVMAIRLAEHLARTEHRYTYRLVWAPGTIGAITWLARSEPVLPRLRHGLVLSCVGDPGSFTYKRSRQGRAEIDRVAEHVLKNSGHGFQITDFAPLGYDERQYCSPGYDLPVGCFMRTPNGKYPEYHTSADNLDLVKPEALADSLLQLLHVVEALELNRVYVNLAPRGEPQLGRRGLYRQMGGTANEVSEAAMLWVLNQSDGTHALLDIAERSGLELRALSHAAEVLVRHELCRRME